MFEAPTNADRAGWAQVALEAFVSVCPTDDCDAIADLIVDLCHLARKRAEGQGEEFDAAKFLQMRAAMHDMELEEDEEGDEPERGFAHSPDRCPSMHHNGGDDICSDCGEDLN